MELLRLPECVVFGDEAGVTAVSQRRLGLEPKGWQVPLRAAIREGIQGLAVKPGLVLHAAYGSAVAGDFFDTENALFYNVGPANFHKAVGRRLVFATLPPFVVEESVGGDGENFSHLYRYSMVAAPPWAIPQNVAAVWKGVAIPPLRGDKKPLDFWLAMRRGLGGVDVLKHLLSAGFGMGIRLHVPAGIGVKLANCMKPLLDGVICAFHSPVPPRAEWCGEVSGRIGCEEALLLDTAKCALGPRNYVDLYRSYVKWDPRDDDCHAVDLEVIEDGGESFSMDGYLYSLAPTLRPFKPEDTLSVMKVFHAAVQEGCRAFYTQNQLNAWSPEPEKEDLEKRKERFLRNYTLLALDEKGEPLGFASLASGGVFDHLFVHPACQRQGVATALADAIEQQAKRQGERMLATYASQAAKGFFLQRGWQLVRDNTAEVRGERLQNFLLQKPL